MSYEAGSRECRVLTEAKENLIKVMASLSAIESTVNINNELKIIYNKLEDMHEERRNVENVSQ